MNYGRLNLVEKLSIQTRLLKRFPVIKGMNLDS